MQWFFGIRKLGRENYFIVGNGGFWRTQVSIGGVRSIVAVVVSLVSIKDYVSILKNSVSLCHRVVLCDVCGYF